MRGTLEITKIIEFVYSRFEVFFFSILALFAGGGLLVALVFVAVIVPVMSPVVQILPTATMTNRSSLLLGDNPLMPAVLGHDLVHPLTPKIDQKDPKD